MSNTAGIATVIVAAAAGALAWFWPRQSQSGSGGGGWLSGVSWAPWADPWDVPAGQVDIGPITVLDDWDGMNDSEQSEMSNEIFGSVDGKYFGNPSLPRGIRNNNPGNLVLTGTPWRGKRQNQTDGRFIQFETPVYGIRAMSRVLDTYREQYGLNTVAEIIGRWAPEHENDTGAYANFVASRMGIEPNQYFPATDSMKLHLVTAIILFENGSVPYSTATVMSGIQAA